MVPLNILVDSLCVRSFPLIFLLDFLSIYILFLYLLFSIYCLPQLFLHFFPIFRWVNEIFPSHPTLLTPCINSATLGFWTRHLLVSLLFPELSFLHFLTCCCCLFFPLWAFVLNSLLFPFVIFIYHICLHLPRDRVNLYP